MSLNTIIQKILKEENEEWVDVSPEYFEELLTYVNGDGSIIKKLPEFKNKKINITGDLDLSGKKGVTNIDSIDYVNGRLDITGTNIKFFNKNKVKKHLSYWRTPMYQIERKKINNKKLEHQKELRNSGSWDGEDEISNKTTALYDFFIDTDIINVEVGEDKYFIEKRDNQLFAWIGEAGVYDDLFYLVLDEDEAHKRAYDYLSDLIDDVGFGAFSDWVWDHAIDEDALREWYYDDYYDLIWDDPDGWDIKKELTAEQVKYIKIWKKNISVLQARLENENLTDEQIDEINDDIYDYENLIEEEEENPKGDYDSDEIERKANDLAEDTMSDEGINRLKNFGFDDRYLLNNFYDKDKAIEYVIDYDGVSETLNRVDGSEYIYDVNGTDYYIIPEQ